MNRKEIKEARRVGQWWYIQLIVGCTIAIIIMPFTDSSNTSTEVNTKTAEVEEVSSINTTSECLPQDTHRMSTNHSFISSRFGFGIVE